MVNPNTKHIQRKYHMLREHIQDGRIKVHKIAGKDNPSDLMTKDITKVKREHLIGEYVSDDQE